MPSWIMPCTGLPSATEAEVIYAVTVINSQALHGRILAALSKGLFGGRNIHRAPFLIPWPEYDPTSSLHNDIVATGREAEIIAATIDVWGATATVRNRVRSALEAQIGDHMEERVEQLLRSAGTDQQLEEGTLAVIED